MSIIKSILFILSIIVLDSSIATVVNNRPIIGVLTQELSPLLRSKYNGYRSFIVASYVKFLEGAGARVVPIWIGRNDNYYTDIMSQINGVLWPGGGSSFDKVYGYADTGERIYKIAKRMNDEGDYFPIFSICLGFELLTYVTANRSKHRKVCEAEGLALPLEFTSDYQRSVMFRNASDEIINILRSNNVTMNSHTYCITMKALQTAHIADKFHVLSLNRDVNGIEFISSLESIDYPFFGVQFHPEKNLYEWAIGYHIPHSKSAALVSQYFANFFVDEARKNQHAFRSKEIEFAKLIYNYPVTYTASKNVRYMQTYLFD
ncbi:gamma-glutamyl hydrolase B-like [Ptiloglossa arizonensis]|uniref:gamma-glutamyl hydrolase B-like n=1 Tax=Ptiloglossa arizonensis TaxID=3350558 RepID=UPI003F9F7A71